ncbi:DUF4113 domain-containing protein [Leptolyngbya sp. KIOST-1]|uniref:DUF4113 domain-containing protein n=1 Tax=Leptolyngbya sp. KIOST-1 TaxID=1229172 RepID=UPI000565CDF6|nr:DUF4113 domain-containing protein [Leptolyngbya sp. KIOST-1]
MDNLNRKLSPDAVKFGALGLKPRWAMRSEYFSKRYTTHWGELPTVRVWKPVYRALILSRTLLQDSTRQLEALGLEKSDEPHLPR